MAKVRVRTNKLKENMILGADVYTMNGVVLVPAGTVVNKEVMHILTNHFVDQVIIEYDDAKAMNASTSVAAKDMKAVRFEKFSASFQIAKEDVCRTLDDIVFKEREINVEELLGSLNQLIDQSSNAIDLCSMLYDMKASSDGVYTHSINVSLIGQLLGGWMGLPKEEIDLIGILGLLHDIGKLKIPDEILNKASPLDRKEIIIFERHVIDGYNILKNKELDYRIKQAVLTHHERMDGSGYPLKVDANQITKFSRIIAIGDTYDIMTTKQPNREALSPFEVVENFETEGYNRFDPSIMMIFLSNILEPFINRYVKLNNGLEGRVILLNRANLSRPLVQVGGSFIDLSIRRELKIVEVVRNKN